MKHKALHIMVLFISLIAGGAAAQTVPPNVVVGTPNQQPAEEEAEENKLPDRLTTLFFTPAERRVLARAKLYYSRQGLSDDDFYDEEGLLDQLRNVRIDSGVEKLQEKQVLIEQERYYTQFYLESIIYHSPTDWKVRVKENLESKEYSAYAPGDDRTALRVISISREQVTFEWSPPDWNRIEDSYKDPQSAIYLDKAEQKVIFSLMVNQTLFSYDMTLREGQMNLVENVTYIEEPEEALPAQDVLPDLFLDDSFPTFEDEEL